MKKLPNQERLKVLFEYQQDTGSLIRKTKVVGCEIGDAAGTKSMGYLFLNVDGKLYLAHRVIWKIVYGADPKEIDHINGIGTDNRVENLREVTHGENSRNQKRRSSNTSGVMGVGWNKKTKKWEASITIFGKKKHLGLFKEKTDAVLARKCAESEHGFHKNHGRICSHKDRVGSPQRYC